MCRCIMAKPLFVCVCPCACVCVCVSLTGEAVSRECLGERRRVSMQQIKNDLVPFHESIMKDGFGETDLPTCMMSHI